MNERIKELAKDHLVHERFTTYGESIQEDYYEMYPDELEKFAELLVRECVSVAMEQYDDAEPWGGIREVLKHFGVEE